MPEQYSDKQILDLAEGIFGIDGMRPRHQLRVLLKKHAEHDDHPLAPIYLRRRHNNGSFLEVHPSGDRKGVEFMLHATSGSRTEFAISKDSLGHYSDTQRELIATQLKTLYQGLDKLELVRNAPTKESALV